MNPILRNVLAVIGAILGGMALHMAILFAGIPFMPEGIEPMDAKSLTENIHRFTAINYAFPLLAHGLGTLLSGYLAVIIAASHKMKFAIGTGVFWLLGGIGNAFDIDAPLWFDIVDITLAYIPMALLGAKLGMKKQKS